MLTRRERQIRRMQLAVVIPLILVAAIISIYLKFWAGSEAREIMWGQEVLWGFTFGSPRFLLVVALLVLLIFLVAVPPWRRGQKN